MGGAKNDEALVAVAVVFILVAAFVVMRRARAEGAAQAKEGYGPPPGNRPGITLSELGYRGTPNDRNLRLQPNVVNRDAIESAVDLEQPGRPTPFEPHTYGESVWTRNALLPEPHIYGVPGQARTASGARNGIVRTA